MTDFGRIYKDIMSLDSNIRMVTICGLNGIIMYSLHREGVKNLLNSELVVKRMQIEMLLLISLTGLWDIFPK
jgi:hypothetical protein